MATSSARVGGAHTDTKSAAARWWDSGVLTGVGEEATDASDARGNQTAQLLRQ
jgi:hypothetical protein